MTDPQPLRRRLPGLPPGWTYMLVLVVFGVFAVSASAVRPREVSGLPSDPEVAEARALLGDGVVLDAPGLRVRASLLDGGATPKVSEPDTTDVAAPGDVAPGAEDLERAARLLDLALARRPFDPRLAAACGTLDYARGLRGRAERHFRAAIAANAHYPEARLLLGALLATRARDERLRPAIRSLELQAIAQFAAVPEQAPEYPLALYNRALLLARVGRGGEARACASAYFNLDPDGPWAERLARAIARGGGAGA